MVDIPDIGQEVQIEVNGHNGKTTHEGVILHPAAKNHVTIKLVNGYNASYHIDEITSIQVTGSISEQAPTSNNSLTFKAGLPHVRIIHTGGTIASKVDYKTGAVVAKFEPEELTLVTFL